MKERKVKTKITEARKENGGDGEGGGGIKGAPNNGLNGTESTWRPL